MHHLLSQNMADLPVPKSAFDRVRKMADRMPCLQLVYSDLEDAVAILRQAFGGAELLDAAMPLGAELPLPVRDRAAAPAADPARKWRRAPGVALRRHGQSSFLWRAGGPMIWQLNPVASAVWALLEIPGSAEQIGALLAEVYPDVDAAFLTRDAARLIGAMEADELVF